MKCGNSHSSQDYQTAKHDFRRKHRRSNSHVVRIGGFEARAGEQLHVRSDGQLEWNRTWTTENPQHDAATKTGIFWKQWYIVQTTSGGSNTMPTRQHSELGQAHCARMEHDSTQRVTAGQAGSSASSSVHISTPRTIVFGLTQHTILVSRQLEWTKICRWYAGNKHIIVV